MVGPYIVGGNRSLKKSWGTGVLCNRTALEATLADTRSISKWSVLRKENRTRNVPTGLEERKRSLSNRDIHGWNLGVSWKGAGEYETMAPFLFPDFLTKMKRGSNNGSNHFVPPVELMWCHVVDPPYVNELTRYHFSFVKDHTWRPGH